MTPSVLIVSSLVGGGGAAVAEDLAARLRGRGWRTVVTSRMASRPLRLADMVATAWRCRHQYGVALVDVFSGPAFIWAECVCWTLKRAGKPHVLALRGGGLPEFARRWPRRVRRLLQGAAAVVAPSAYLRESMRGFRSDIRVIPNAIEVARYPYRRRERPDSRLAWLRAFHRIYNPALAPRALACVIGEFPEATLDMYGPDKGDGSLGAARRVARELGLDSAVRFGGPIAKSEVPSRLAEADVFLNTTNVDNTPVSVIEAMACGLCIVSTDVGGIPYLLEDDHDALLVPPDDQDAMAAAVRRILTEPGLAAHLSENARRKAEQFDWSIVLPQWERLLLEVLEKGSA